VCFFLQLQAIIISGPPSVGKTTVAKDLAKKFGIKLVGGGDILKEFASERGYHVSGNDWWDTQEGIRFLEERKTNFNFDKKVDERLCIEAQNGDVVITSYTLPWLTEYGIKVWLKGSVENRAKRMAERDGIDLEAAKEAVRSRDSKNTEHYRKLYKIEFGKDLTVFDFVINTDLFTKDRVVKVCRNLIEEVSQ
jgi:cytidylate kinase